MQEFFNICKSINMIHHISKLESKNDLKKKKLECSALYILFAFCLAESIRFQSYFSQHIITLSPSHCQTHLQYI